MQDIRTWLASSRPYYDGIALYLQHGTDPLLQRLFREDYSDYKAERLVEALESLLSDAPAPADDQQQNKLDELEEENIDLQDQVEELELENDELRDANDDLAEENENLRKQAVKAPKGWPAEMDETVKALYDEWLPAFKERHALKARVLDVALLGETDADKKTEAGEMAHRILDLRDQCQGIYKKRDHYLQHGKLPEENPLPKLVVNPKQHPKCLANHQRYLRDYKAQLRAAGTDEDRERIQKNIDLQQRYVDHYTKLLS